MKIAQMTSNGDIEAIVEHRRECPVSDPARLCAHLRKFVKPDGTFDVTTSRRDPLCNCDFLQRFKAALAGHRDICEKLK